MLPTTESGVAVWLEEFRIRQRLRKFHGELTDRYKKSQILPHSLPQERSRVIFWGWCVSSGSHGRPCLCMLRILNSAKVKNMKSIVPIVVLQIERDHYARDITYTIKKSTHKHKKRTFTSEGRKEHGWWWSSIHIHKRTHARRGEEKKEGVWNLMLFHHLTWTSHAAEETSSWFKDLNIHIPQA